MAAIETSDLKMKVATLEGELKQQQESLQAVGEEPRHTALHHMPCAGWCGCMSPSISVPWGSRVKIKGTTKEGGPGGTLLGDNSRQGATFYFQNPPQAGFRAPFCGSGH